jgi:peptide/nickel transport system ATP-binding protein
MASLLEIRHVTKVYSGGLLGRRQKGALEDFSLDISADRASITAVVGESGSGKTTLARLLLGLISPTRGEVLYKGKDLRTLTPAERKDFRREVQVIFQDPFEVYNPFYKVDHVLEMPIAKFGLAHSREDARRLMVEALETVGLRAEETLGRYPHQLSGGQRQRVMVARAFLLRPRLIVADEPVSMIDASLRATVLGSLRKLNEEFGISFIYITHDLATAYQISQNIIVLYAGSVAETGDVELVVNQPQHPYTRLLTGSIPMPDPDHHWGVGAAAGPAADASLERGCKFAPRCPHVMPKCREAAPPLFQTHARRLAACYLYDASPAVQPEEVGASLAASAPAAS